MLFWLLQLLQYNLKSGSVLPSAFFFLLRLFWLFGFFFFFFFIQSLEFFYYCVKNDTGILIVLNLQIALGSMAIITILILPIYEHGMFFHMFVSSLISLSSGLQFSSYKSFTSLISYIPRQLILFVATVNGSSILIWLLA